MLKMFLHPLLPTLDKDFNDFLNLVSFDTTYYLPIIETTYISRFISHSKHRKCSFPVYGPI